jgi:hypothetical protein
MSAMEDVHRAIKSETEELGILYAIRALVYVFAGRHDDALEDINRAKSRSHGVIGHPKLTQSLVRHLEAALGEPLWSNLTKARLDELAKRAERDEIEWELACEADLDSDPACRGYFNLTEPAKWRLLEYLFVYDLDFIAEQWPNRAPVPYTEWTQSEVANEDECYRIGEERWFEMHRRLDGVASGWYYCSTVNTSLNFGGPR